jgi:hypothetical protein
MCKLEEQDGMNEWMNGVHVLYFLLLLLACTISYLFNSIAQCKFLHPQLNMENCKRARGILDMHYDYN